jgi:hypothetical protein
MGGHGQNREPGTRILIGRSTLGHGEFVGADDVLIVVARRIAPRRMRKGNRSEHVLNLRVHRS